MRLNPRSYSAYGLAVAVLEGENPEELLRGHRVLRIEPDASHDGWLNIPVVYARPGRYTHMFKIEGDNPKPKLKERILELLRTRRGYRPGDVFVSPWGRFLVTDIMGLKEI